MKDSTSNQGHLEVKEYDVGWSFRSEPHWHFRLPQEKGKYLGIIRS